MAFVKMLEAEKVDLIEVSGGTYEKLAMADGVEEKDSTKQRKAYFLEFSEKLVQHTSIPGHVYGWLAQSSGHVGSLGRQSDTFGRLGTSVD